MLLNISLIEILFEIRAGGAYINSYRIRNKTDSEEPFIGTP
jgi:hypothetical protein